MPATPASPALKTCKVPKVKGKSLARAKALLKKAGCATGKVTKKKAKGKKKGTVLSSSPAPGRTQKAGTKVALTIVK